MTLTVSLFVNRQYKTRPRRRAVNGHCCPKYALEEAKLAYVTHQNDIIRSSLTLAIKEGRAVANTTGETVIDLSSVDFEKLKLYIERSEEFQMEMTAEVKDLMSAGKQCGSTIL